MTYSVKLHEQAERDLIKLAKNEPKAFLKAQQLIEELSLHPPHGYRPSRTAEGRAVRAVE